jgi:hypothetical protein
MTPEVAALLAALAACLLLPRLVLFVTAPVRMRATNWQPADPEYTPDDEAALPPEARALAAGLRALGFENRGTWRPPGGPAASGRLALLEHPRTRDAARVLVVTAGTKVSVTLAFQTRFADGTEVVTANNRVTAGFPVPPEVTAAWLPEVRDPAALFRVHDQLREAVGRANTPVPIGPDPAGYLRDGSTRTHDKWVSAGYYRRDEGARVLRPTWKGAVLVTWRLMWPVKPLFRARRRRATRETLARYGVTPEG